MLECKINFFLENFCKFIVNTLSSFNPWDSSLEHAVTSLTASALARQLIRLTVN